MRKITTILIILIASILFTSCVSSSYVEEEIFAMNTIITVRIPQGNQADDIIRGTEELIASLEKEYSATYENSDIGRFNSNNNEHITLSYDTEQVLNTALAVSKATEGKYDPTVKPLTDLWGITNGNTEPPASRYIKEALTFVDYSLLSINEGKLTTLKDGVKLDLGGIGKGYALQKSLEYLKKSGIEYGLVSFGGNVGVFGEKPDKKNWSVSIKDPRNEDNIVGTLDIEKGFVSVSGDYERYFIYNNKRYCHIFDPQTGYPPENGVQSVAVYTQDGALGDSLSTALFVMGYEAGEELYKSEQFEFEALFICDDGVHMTDGMKEIYKEKK